MMQNHILEVKNLHVSVLGKEILKGIRLSVNKGETHVVMGPNGSGKSTLANALMGNPKYKIGGGEIFFQNENISGLAPEDRAKMGMFLAFQYPKEIAGVQMDRFLFLAYNNLRKAENPNMSPLSVFDFRKKIDEEIQTLTMSPELASRGLNEGFSGGEKKKAEMLQLGVLKPKFAILDETDSGLDVDAMEIVGKSLRRFQSPEKCVLLVTHYPRFLQYIKPDFVHVMVQGKIVESGGAKLADTVEREGYGKYL